MSTFIKRIIRAGWISLKRNIWLGVAQIIVMMMVVLLVSFFFIFNKASDVLISKIQEKVDISVYFKSDTDSEKIFSLKSDLSKLSEIKTATYISKDDALESFMKKHMGDTVLIDSLNEVGENPFLASLSIQARNASQYAKIQSFLDKPEYKDIIDRVDYFQRKPVIDKIFFVTSSINKGTLIFSIILFVLAFLVALNTIRVAIYNSKDEIATMRLVGASNFFIRDPFIIQGIFLGLIAAALSFILVFVVSFFLDGKIRMLDPEIKLIEIFFSSFWMILFLQALTGVGLGIVSSVVGIRKYLNV